MEWERCRAYLSTVLLIPPTMAIQPQRTSSSHQRSRSRYRRGVDGVDNRGHQENRCPLACGWPRCDAVETWGQVVDTRGNLVEPSTLAMQRSTPPRHLSTPRLQLS